MSARYTAHRPWVDRPAIVGHRRKPISPPRASVRARRATPF